MRPDSNKPSFAPLPFGTAEIGIFASNPIDGALALGRCNLDINKTPPVSIFPDDHGFGLWQHQVFSPHQVNHRPGKYSRCYAINLHVRPILSDFECLEASFSHKGGVGTHYACNPKKVRYTVPNAETTAGGFSSPVKDGNEPSRICSAAFLLPTMRLYGQSGRGAARLAGVLSGLLTRSELPTRLAAGVRLNKPELKDCIMQDTLTIGSSAIREIDGLYSLNDLHKASGGEEKHQPAKFVRLDQTQAIVAELAKSPEMANCLKSSRGANGGTYACKELVIAYAAWISAAFHLKVIRVFLDTLPQQPSLPHYITNEQAGEISTLVAMRFPDGKDRPYAWSRFNNHFRLDSYKHLPATRFDEAVDYVNQMPIRGQGLEDTLQRLTDQLSEKNSYPIALFEPLVKAYLDKTGDKLVKAAERISIRNRRWMVYFDCEGNEQVKEIPKSAALVDCDSKAALYTLLVESIPTHLVPEAISHLAIRVEHHINWTNKKIGVAA